MTKLPVDRAAAEAWFLHRGVPAVLSRRARWRRVWSRSAPALAALAVVPAVALAIVLASGGGTVVIEGTPDPQEWLLIALLLAALPVMGTVCWLVGRIADERRRRWVATAAVAFMAATDVLFPTADGRLAELLQSAAMVAGVLVATGIGAGSVLGWGLRLAATHLAAARFLVIRALPVLLLTFLVFFNGPVWSMAATIDRGRLWAALAFLGLISAAFAVSGLLDRVRPMVRSGQADAGDRLRGTPFEALPDADEPAPLRPAERLNLLFVLAATQLTQILAVAVVTGALFLVLGLILLSPEVLAAWAPRSSPDGTVLGMTLPVPQALIHVTMFLAGLTFMYISARAVEDARYRADFLDPLVDDLRLTLVARNRYRHLE